MKVEEHASRQAASQAVAECLANGLREQLRRQCRAALAVSGGATPGDCLQALSHAALPWRRVSVTLTDERCVPSDHPDRNEIMVQQRLLANQAAAASFVQIEEERLAALPTPLAGVLLGMGEDGHFASLFPDAPNLAQGLALDNPAHCLAVRTAAKPNERISLTLSFLTQAEQILLLAFGARKRTVLETPLGLPVQHLLQQKQAPLRILWAP